jgi:hypothetical protein
MMEAVHRRLAQGLLERRFLSERQACDLVFQDARRRPPSAFQMMANEMTRLRRFLADHGITLPRASSSKGYYLPANEKEKLRAVLNV